MGLLSYVLLPVIAAVIYQLMLTFTAKTFPGHKTRVILITGD